ncbi:YfjI family protein [Variovorax rhizosphaerae]|uniref:YfjI family protein n=1 Tax=Variovorax rhizosphaerae TaxID=1836200 RepID=A0ABU8WHG0_9BURK
MSAVLADPVNAALNAALPVAGGWPLLNPMPDDEPITPDAFPFHALGPILGAAARAIAHDVQAPDSLAGGSVLAAAGLASSPLANVYLPHGQRAPLSLFVVTGAGSGDRKSAVDAVACHEIEETRKQQARDYSKQLQDYEQDMAARKGPKESEPTKPAPKSITTGNATIEGISKLLKFQASIGVFSAEGGEMLGGHSMRDERRQSGLAFYLKGWSGESLDSLRGGEGLTVLLGRRISMHVLVQPVLLRQLLTDPLAQGQGLLARCLIAEPDTLAGTRLYRHVNPHENRDVIAYNERIRRLLETPPNFWPDGDGHELKPRDLRLNAEAQAIWVAFHNQVEVQQKNGDELEGARPFASKAAEHAARIAGVITMIDEPYAVQIGAEAMEGAIEITAFYLNEHLRLTGAGRQERQAGNLRELHAWMQRVGPMVLKKDVLQKSPRRIGRKASSLNPLLKELADRGYIREVGGEWEVRDV